MSAQLAPSQSMKQKAFADFAAEIANTSEIRQLLNSLASDVFTTWGNKGDVRFEMAKHAKRILGRKLTQSETARQAKSLQTVLQSPYMSRHLAKAVPMLLNNLLEAIQCMAVSLENLSRAEQATFFQDLLSSIETEKIGAILTSLAKTTESVHQENPKAFSQYLSPSIKNAFSRTDFGKLKASFNGAGEDIDDFLAGINDLLFEFPAKMILIFSFLPGMGNHLLFFLEDLLKRFNALPADLLADVLISFFNEIDSSRLGRLINSLNEMVRQLHTGSALIGEPGVPKFSIELLQKTKKIMREIDPDIARKAKMAWLDGKETFVQALDQTSDPEQMGSRIQYLMEKRNSRVRMRQNIFNVLEHLDSDTTVDALSEGLSSWNVYELAELVNSISQTFNILQNQAPEVLQKLGQEFINTLDMDEVEESVELFSRDLGRTFRPLLRTVVPIVVKNVIGHLEPDGDMQDDAIFEMRKSLRDFILGEEVSG